LFERKVIQMSEKNEKDDKAEWATGGGLLLGLGVGFFFFPQSIFGPPSVFVFIGCIIGGLGLGLILTAILSIIEKRR
jgi:protein-S-isoprenylcysteine O-methyltransferase Ste14